MGVEPLFKMSKQFRIEGLLAAFVLSAWLAGCGGVKKGDDIIQFTNGGSGENGVLVDGKQGGKQRNDMTFTGAAGADIAFRNVLPSKDSNEVIAFTLNRPPALVEDAGWTKGLDTVPVAYQDEFLVPIYLWVVNGPFSTQSTRAASIAAITEQIWNDERQGIGFSLVDIRDATMDPDAGDFVDFTCGLASDMKARIGFNSAGINVYFVSTIDFGSGPSTTSGVWCGSSRIVAVGSGTNGGLFAHEVGHAFRLGHVNDLTTFFDRTNVMHNASSTRRYLTEGQTFRAVLNASSAVNMEYNLRPGQATRDCGLITSTAIDPCPPVQKRIWADGVSWPPN